MIKINGPENKANIAALLTAVIVILFAVANIDVTADLHTAIEVVASAVAGAIVVRYGTWRVPNKSSEPND